MRSKDRFDKLNANGESVKLRILKSVRPELAEGFLVNR
jgi:hypothetical protein